MACSSGARGLRMVETTFGGAEEPSFEVANALEEEGRRSYMREDWAMRAGFGGVD